MKKKIPNSAFPTGATASKRVVVTEHPGSYYDYNPSWQFHRMYREFAYGNENFWGWPAFKEDGNLVWDRLRDLNGIQWKEILSNRDCHREHHMVYVSNLAEEPRRYLQELEPGLEKVMSFRFGNTYRLYGKVTESGVFQALLWDRKHKVYPMSHER